MEEKAKRTTVTKADALKMMSKTAEAPMPTETWEGDLKTAAEAHKRLDMVSEELKLMDYVAGATNRIIQGVVEMFVSKTEEE